MEVRHGARSLGDYYYGARLDTLLPFVVDDEPGGSSGRAPSRTIGGSSTGLHHAHLVQTNGESHRLAQALAGKGVIALA